MKIILAKMGLDGHDKGLRIIARALTDAGAEVVYLGLRQSAESIVNAALQEDASDIGVSILSGIHLESAEKLLAVMKEKNCTDIRVSFGGTIPEQDAQQLEKMGVAGVFKVETKLEDILSFYLGTQGESASVQPTEASEFKTASDLEVKPFYTCDDIDESKVRDEAPGTYPYTRGVYESMYRGKVWTMRQYAGFGTAVESNERYKYLLSQGQTGLSVALDLPTQIGYDSDEPSIAAEVGKVGVAIDTVEDMHTLFEGIPLDKVSVNFTINATAIVLLSMLVVVAEEQGLSPEVLRGTVQNDMIKEFLSRNTYIFPLESSMKIVGDIITYAAEHIPRFNPISCSGYHIRELGANAVQELAFTLAAGLTYVSDILERGIPVDQFAGRLSFQLSCNQDIFEEAAKFRAARRMWATLVKERFHPENPKSMLFRVFSGGNGISFTAKEPLNNIIRGAFQCLTGALGGAQAIHVPAYDEAYAIPTAESALLSLRTQQITAFETGIINTADPLAGSYYVESLTDTLEAEAMKIIEEIERRGGMKECIKSGWIKSLVIDSAYKTQRKIDSGERTIVGVNKFNLDTVAEEYKIETSRSEVLENQLKRLDGVKTSRDGGAVQNALEALGKNAAAGENLFPPVIACVRKRATVGEIVATLKTVFGEYDGD